MLILHLTAAALAWGQPDCEALARALAQDPAFGDREARLRAAAQPEDAAAGADLTRLGQVSEDLTVAGIEDPALREALLLRACGVLPPPPEPTQVVEEEPLLELEPRPSTAEAPAPADPPPRTPEQAQAQFEQERLVRDTLTFTLHPRLDAPFLSAPPPAPSWDVTQGGQKLSALDFARQVGDTRTLDQIGRDLRRQQAAGRGMLTAGVVGGLVGAGLMFTDETRPTGTVLLGASALTLGVGAGRLWQLPRARSAPVSDWYTEAEADAAISAWNGQLQVELGLVPGG